MFDCFESHHHSIDAALKYSTNIYCTGAHLITEEVCFSSSTALIAFRIYNVDKHSKMAGVVRLSRINLIVIPFNLGHLPTMLMFQRSQLWSYSSKVRLSIRAHGSRFHHEDIIDHIVLALGPWSA